MRGLGKAAHFLNTFRDGYNSAVDKYLGQHFTLPAPLEDGTINQPAQYRIMGSDFENSWTITLDNIGDIRTSSLGSDSMSLCPSFPLNSHPIVVETLTSPRGTTNFTSAEMLSRINDLMWDRRLSPNVRANGKKVIMDYIVRSVRIDAFRHRPKQARRLAY